MKFSVASYSFHRLLAEGKQDMFKYIEDCKALGMALLDPWNGHLVPLVKEDEALKKSDNWSQATFSDEGLAYVAQVKAAADAAGLPFGCLAVDGAHIYEPTEEARAKNRASAYRWLDVARRLGATQLRIDTGGTADLTDEVLKIVVEGYNDIIARAKPIDIVLENHWGASNIPANVVRVIEAVPGLRLLFDTNNWAEGMQQEGWDTCAKYATSVHIKTFEFDANGNDPTVDIPRIVKQLAAQGYNGVWGIESVPRDGDEYGAVKKTMALIERSLS